MSADGTGVVSHVGTRLLADVAAAAGLPEAFDDAAGGRRRRRSAHTPGRVLTDVAVLLADGGETITDLAVLRDQPGLFGPVASTATAWRVLDSVDDRRSGRAEAGSGGGAGTGLAAARPRRAGRSRRCAAAGSWCPVW